MTREGALLRKDEASSGNALRATYALDWNFVLSRPLQPHDERWARERDEQGRKFTVVLWDGERPDRYLTVDRNVGVAILTFLDEHQRAHRAYGFQFQPDGRLFLSSEVTWDYPDGDADSHTGASHITEVFLRPDGYAKQIEREIAADGGEDGEFFEYRDVPMDGNWEPPLVFGQWGSLARKDRDVPAPPTVRH